MKKTPLHKWHTEAGANMAEFGSYHMPLWYPQGTKQEHLSVLTSAGLFDTSHMAVVQVRGKDSFSLLQRTFSKDLARCIGLSSKPLVSGRCVYGLFLKENGHVLDDAIVYKLSDDSFMAVVNSGMGGVLTDHLSSFSTFQDVKIIDKTETLGKIDIQGPYAAKILSKLIERPDKVFEGMGYFSFKGWFEPDDDEVVLDNTPVLLSRTGYTGEFGFEIFMNSSDLHNIWEKLIDAGGESLLPCGLAARDSLRAGAVLPLSHQDIGEWKFAHNPWLFALPYDGKDGKENDGKFSKSFVGSDALLANQETLYTYPFAGFDPRKISAGKDSIVHDGSGNAIGTVLTCTTDMALSRIEGGVVSITTPVDKGKPADFKAKGLSCGFLLVKKVLNEGDRVVLIEEKRKIEVEIRKDIRPYRSARNPIRAMI